MKFLIWLTVTVARSPSNRAYSRLWNHVGDAFQLFLTNFIGESQFFHIPHSNSQSYKALKLGVTGISPGDRDSRPTDAADD